MPTGTITAMTDNRASQRSSRLMRGVMELPDEKSHDILIRNISSHGIGAKFSGEMLQVGTPVTVEITTLGEFSGTIRWHNEGRIGIELAEELDPAAVHFGSERLNAQENRKYEVAIRFQPVTTTYRPGFGKK